MKTRALGFLLMVAAAGVYAVGCGSSNNNGGTGGAGTGGKGGAGAGGTAAGGTGAGGTGAGGKVDAGTDTNTGAGGKVDAGGDTNTGAGGKVDAGTDTTSNTDTAADMAPGDAPADTQAAPTFSDVYAIIGNITTPAADTSPGCKNCHDGVLPDGGTPPLPHGLNFSTKAAAYAALVGVDSLRCPGVDGGAAIKRVLAGNAAQSVLWQKLNQGLNPTQPACAPQAMPRQVFVANDGGADAGADAGFTQTTHYAITADQLATVMNWINAGALNN